MPSKVVQTKKRLRRPKSYLPFAIYLMLITMIASGGTYVWRTMLSVESSLPVKILAQQRSESGLIQSLSRLIVALNDVRTESNSEHLVKLSLSLDIAQSTFDNFNRSMGNELSYSLAISVQNVRKTLNALTLEEKSPLGLSQSQVSVYHIRLTDTVENLSNIYLRTNDAALLTLNYQIEQVEQLRISLMLAFILILIGIVAIRRFIQQQKQSIRILKETQLELSAAKEKAEKANQLKNQFVSNISHELRTPLTALQGALSLIEGGAFDQDLPQIKSLATLGNRNVKRLTTVVNDLLDIKQLESGQLSYDIKPHSYIELVYEAIDAISEFANKNNVSIIIEKKIDKEIKIEIDSTRIIQVITNLLSNAIKYTGVEHSVFVNVEIVHSEIKTSVTDQGPGIAREHHSKLFDEFYQVNTVIDKKNASSGLGLGICKKIITDLQGEIGLISELGEGATFYILLPMENH